MDLRSYYRKLREVEATIPDEHVVLVSLATPEGGKAGVRTEAPKAIAAKLIAEGRARLADFFHPPILGARRYGPAAHFRRPDLVSSAVTSRGGGGDGLGHRVDRGR